MRRFTTFFIFFSFIFAAAFVQAQTPVEVEHALNLIDSANDLAKLRSDRFGEEITKVNTLNVLDVPSLDKSTVLKNIKKIKDFIDFLDVSRSLNKQANQAFEDSVDVAKEQGLTKKMTKAYDELIKAYASDQKALDKFSLALSKVYTGVVKILTYLDSCDYTIKDKRLLFTEKKQSERYAELFKELEESQKKAAYANADSQKAGIEAREVIHKIYSDIQK